MVREGMKPVVGKIDTVILRMHNQVRQGCVCTCVCMHVCVHACVCGGHA